MKKISGYKFWLRPTPEQEVTFLEWMETIRRLWNRALGVYVDFEEELKLAAMGAGATIKKAPKGYDGDLVMKPRAATLFNMGAWIKIWKSKDVEYLKKVPALFCNGTLQRLERAWTNYFEKAKTDEFKEKRKRRAAKGKSVKNYGKPKFVQHGRQETLMSHGLAKNLKFRSDAVWVPNMGWVKCKMHRVPSGKLKAITIIKHPKRWMIAMQFEEEIPDPIHSNPHSAVGVDMGVRKTVATSDKEYFILPDKAVKEIERLERRKLRYERALARKRADRKKLGLKGCSKRYIETRRRLARVYARITAIREEFLHQISRSVADDYETVVVENLNIANMTASAKGTKDKPGKNVRQKAGLNRNILSQGLYKLRSQIDYKTRWAGGCMVAINPAYTSQQCSVCGHTEKSNRVKENFKCLACDNQLDADYNAAINILAKIKPVAAQAISVRRSREEDNAPSPELHQQLTGSCSDTHTNCEPGENNPPKTTPKAGFAEMQTDVVDSDELDGPAVATRTRV